MKKLLLLLFIFPLFVACSDNDENEGGNIKITVIKDSKPVEDAEVRLYNFQIKVGQNTAYIGNAIFYISGTKYEMTNDTFKYHKTSSNGSCEFRNVQLTKMAYSVDYKGKYIYSIITENENTDDIKVTID